MTQPLPPAILLMGPTASGKTELAVDLLCELPLEIISVDSAMIYRHMDIGTAKPDAVTLSQAPHRLIDFLDPAETYSVARFLKDALREMADITAQGKIPLLVGGSMLYFRALQRGLSDLPEADEQVRARLTRQASQHGWAFMHERLQQVDPQAAARIHPNDPQRIQRALEVFEISGKPMTLLYANPADPPLPYRLVKLALIPSQRFVLHDRIAQRFRRMLAKGLITEVEKLYQRPDLSLNKPSMRSVGYRQVWQYLDSCMNFSDMLETAIIQTKQLAKRQLTWLRTEDTIQCLDSLAANNHTKALKILKGHEIH